MSEESLIYRLRKRAEIRRDAKGRKSVLEGKPDRISDLLEEAALEIETLKQALDDRWADCHDGSENSCCKNHD